MASTNPGEREIPFARGERAEGAADAPSSRRPRNVYLLPRPQEEGVESMERETGTRQARGVHRDPTAWDDSHPSRNDSLTSSSVASFSSRTARKAPKKGEEEEEEEDAAAAAPPRVLHLPNGFPSSLPPSDSFSALLEHRKVVTHTRVGGGRLSRRPSAVVSASSLAMGGGAPQDVGEEADHHPPLVVPPPSALPSRARRTEANSPTNDHGVEGSGGRESAIARRRRCRAPLPTESVSTTASKEASILGEAVPPAPPPPPIPPTTTLSQSVRTATHTSSRSSPVTTRTSATSSSASSSRSGGGSLPSAVGGGAAAGASVHGGQEGDLAPPPPGWTKGIETAATSAAAAPPPPPRPSPLDREMFQSLNFRADHFANGLLQRYLNHYITHAPLDASDGTSSRRPPPPSRDRRASLGAPPPPPPPSSPPPPASTGGGVASENDKGSSSSSSSAAAGHVVSEEAEEKKEKENGALNGGPTTTTTTPLCPSSTDTRLYYANVAHALGDVLRSTLQEVEGFARQEAHARRGKEMHAKRVEWEERRHLAHVRTTGLQETMLQLQQYERYIHNAQAATAGIVQHLTQTNARVQRGKAIGVLLKHFRMFLSIPTTTLRHVLSQLSPQREWQRRGVTAWWEALQAREKTTATHGASMPWQTTGGGGDASVPTDALRRSFHFYDIDAGVEEAMLGVLREELRQTRRQQHDGPSSQTSSASSSMWRGDGGGSTTGENRKPNEQGKGSPSVVSSSSTSSPLGGAGPVDGEEEAAVGKRRRKKKVVVKTKKIHHFGAVEAGEQQQQPPLLSSQAEDERRPTTEKKKRKIIRHGHDAADAPLPTVAAIRAAETAAAQAGLDPLFISRRATESQTDWCQRLRLLSAELEEEVARAENSTHFTRWLQEELALDVFHLMARYRVNAEQYPASVLPSLPLGKALLSALELVSRLYVQLAASVEELFVLCISHVVENLRGTLCAEYVPPAYQADPSEGGGGGSIPVGIASVTPGVSSSPTPTTTSGGGGGSAAGVPLAFPLPAGVPSSPAQSAKKPKERSTSPTTTPSGPSVSTPLFLAMEHFSRYTASAFPRILGFLTERVRREGFIVEALSGSSIQDHHSSLAFQQLLSHVVEKIVHPLLTQQIQLAESHKDDMIRREAPLSPRSRRRHVPRVLDAMVYRSTMLLHAILFFQDLQLEFEKDLASPQDACFLHPLGEAIFRAPRARYVDQREELTLLQRTYTYVDESYTRALHAIPEELFDVRPAHTAKLQAMLDALVDSTARVRMVLMHEKEVLPMTAELVACGIRQVGQFFTGELQKAIDSVRGERERWRVKPKSENELLRPTKPEAQQCGFRMLWFIQNALGMVHESLSTISAPLTQRFPRLKIDLERLRGEAFANLDTLGETLFHVSVNAMISSALSILMHYQQKNDFLVTEKSKSVFGAGNADASSSSSVSSPTSRAARDHAPMLSIVPPCTRACTLFCQFITRQFTEAREMIEQSEVMAAAEGSGGAGGGGGGGTGGTRGGGGGEASDGDVLDANGIDHDSDGVMYGRYGEGTGGGGGGGCGRWMSSSAKPAAELYLAKARSMSMAELLYGDGDPSGYTFVRVVGVCLFRGIGAHLKSFVVNDLGALVYKQDVTAYAEVMRPLSTTPTLSGAVVKVLFRMLRETSGLMLMPLDHIKEVKDSGMLQVMHPAEKLAFLKIREDVRIAFRMIHK